MSTDKLCWGVLGTGAIAQTFARNLQGSATGQLTAVGSRSTESARRFGDEFQLPAARCHPSYDQLLADDGVAAVYIATPHPFHAEWCLRAIAAGKHVLCEKPLALNHAEAMAVVEAARAKGVFLMEAFMYRCHPQTAKLIELIRQQAIGEVCVIQATFSFQAGHNPESRLYNNQLGGGGILDVGCYPVSMARLIAGAARNQRFANPVAVTGAGHLGSTGVDEWAVATLKFPGDIVAQLATGIAVQQENVVRIFGSAGCLTLENPWTANRRNPEPGRIRWRKKGEPEPQEIVVPCDQTAFTLEADWVGRSIADGLTEGPAPAMSWDDTLGNMDTLDQWRKAIGLVYESEKPENYTHTVSRQPLTVRQPATMKYGTVTGVGLPVSRLVMGCDNQTTMPQAAVMFDDYFERGGNTFDTSYVYGGGTMERLLGHWIRHRGVRDRVVIIAKGAHTPTCDPVHLTQQLHESLDRLQTDYADIYFMHRDNPAIPVGEFVEVLNEHLRSGRIRAFGGSNWTLDRVRAANRYAKRKGLTGFAAISNNFTLARMIAAPWAGCQAASDPDSRKWFKRTQTPLFAWSSQAQGFFVNGDPADNSRKGLVTCWYSEDNFQRKQRVEQLAAERGVHPVNIALAYVLNQPFPTFALIGPRTLAETRTAWTGLDIELSPRDLRWLNLEI